MSLHNRLTLISIVFFLTSLSCMNSNDKEERVVKYGETEVPFIRDFLELELDNKNSFITHFYAKSYSPRWNSFGVLHGRYSVTMQFDMTIDHEAGTFEQVSEPNYYVIEYTEIIPFSNGGYRSSNFGEQHRINSSDWKKVIDSEGDFSVIGITLKNDDPIKNIEMLKQ